MKQIAVALLLALAGCGGTQTIAGISCPHGDDQCALARQNTLRANNDLPPITMGQWKGTEPLPRSSSASTSTRAAATGFTIIPSRTQVWLESEKLNNMINPQGRIYEIVPTR